MPISVDPASAALLRDDPAFLDRARPLDLLLPNADEFAALAEGLPGVKEVVVKLGADGARWSDGVHTVSVAAVASTTWSTPPAPATPSPPAS